MLKSFIISMVDNSQSQISTQKLIESIESTKSEIEPSVMAATIPETIDTDIAENFPEEYSVGLYKNKQLNYTWPKSPAEDGIDFSTGIYKRAYSAKDWRKVAACTISHMRLWQNCIATDEPILILEHDAYFIRKFSYANIENAKWDGGICGLNEPFGTTRKARVFDSKLKEKVNELGMAIVPYVDGPGDLPLPSGLPGNSAYIIKPWAARRLLEKTLEVGIWPNDAVMCRQFFPWLQHIFPYYTKVQGTKSTTTT